MWVTRVSERHCVTTQHIIVTSQYRTFWCVNEIDYLGYWIMHRGIQPQPKKVEAIMGLTPPTTKRQFRRFLGMINYYCDMWQHRSHIPAPLTALCSAKAKYVWGNKEQKAFKDIKAIMSWETLFAFPDFSKDFHVYADSSDYQLGAVIMQDDRSLAFYSRKLTSAQKRYTTGEQELLSNVETLKELKNILLGQKLIVHTDHKNLLYQKMSTNCIILPPSQNSCPTSSLNRENSGIAPKRHKIHNLLNEH